MLPGISGVLGWCCIALVSAPVVMWLLPVSVPLCLYVAFSWGHQPLDSGLTLMQCDFLLTNYNREDFISTHGHIERLQVPANIWGTLFNLVEKGQINVLRPERALLHAERGQHVAKRSRGLNSQGGTRVLFISVCSPCTQTSFMALLEAKTDSRCGRRGSCGSS